MARMRAGGQSTPRNRMGLCESPCYVTTRRNVHNRGKCEGARAGLLGERVGRVANSSQGEADISRTGCKTALCIYSHQ